MMVALTLALALGGPAEAAEVSVTQRGHASNPVWSPGGDWLAFEVNDFSGSISMYVAKVQGANPVGTASKVSLPGGSSQFGASGSIAAAPAWHPDGMVIFEGSNAGGATRLYFWQPGGAAATELLSVGQAPGDLSWPSFAPNGMRLSFVSDHTGNGDIYAWDRASNKVEKLASSNFSEMAPRYKSDSTTLAYSRKNQGGEDLFMMSNGQSVPRIGGNGDQSRPVWTGESIVYFSNERGEEHWDIVMSAGVGKKLVIARDVRLPIRAAPALSPDGKWVAFGYSDPEKADKIGLVKTDGSGTSANVDTGKVAAGEPCIVESGGRMYLAYTALPSEGADWRKLHIMDVTGKF